MHLVQIAGRHIKTRTVVLQIISIVTVLVVALLMMSRSEAQPTHGAPLAPKGPGPAIVDAGATAAAEASAAPAPSEGKDKDEEAKEPEPIQSAVVGDAGGVPTHPGYKFKSPFGNPAAKTPIRASVGFVLNSIEEYDVKTGTFEADFFLTVTSDRPMPHLDLQTPNGNIENKETLADTPTFRMWRYTAKLKSPPDLRKYPFDRQVLAIQLEDDTYGFDTIRLVPDKERTDVNIGFEVLGWDIAYVEARTLSHAYPDRFENDDLYYNTYVYRIAIDRYGTSAIFKVFVPALVIVLIGLLGMWVPPDEMEVRSNAGAPMLAAAVLFHFALMQELPATSYLTRADKLMIGVYVSLLINMLSTWWMFLVKEENMIVVFRVARWFVPIASVILMATVCVI